MSFLTDVQLQDLSDYIRSSARRHQPLQDELLDHLACLIENKLAAGLDYPTARKEALELFNKDEVKKTEGRTLYFVHTKPVLMKCFLFFSITTLLGFSTWLFTSEKETRIVEETPRVVENPQVPMVEMLRTVEPPDIAPLSGLHRVTAAYGQRVHPVFKKKMLHRGIDFKAPSGTPIVATSDGIVKIAREEKNYGLKIVLQHDDSYQSLYAHLSEIKVKKGENSMTKDRKRRRNTRSAWTFRRCRSKS